jgi:hypothetical protein
MSWGGSFKDFNVFGLKSEVHIQTEDTLPFSNNKLSSLSNAKPALLEDHLKSLKLLSFGSKPEKSSMFSWDLGLVVQLRKRCGLLIIECSF